MDDMVKAAMLKWPNVPACSGWLGLDARGDWYMRDASVQAEGAFQRACRVPEASAAKGSRLRHEGLLTFIGRNYASDDVGRWYFQNGPQRVYVELGETPWIWRLSASGLVHSHTGACVQRIEHSLVDERGYFYLLTELGIGLVHSLDMALAAERVDDGTWRPQNVDSMQIPELYAFVPSPENWQPPADW